VNLAFPDPLDSGLSIDDDLRFDRQNHAYGPSSMVKDTLRLQLSDADEPLSSGFSQRIFHVVTRVTTLAPFSVPIANFLETTSTTMTKRRPPEQDAQADVFVLARS
jgi:hypothetical protein